MKENSRIRFNPVTKEIEVEGSESFVKTYFNKLQAMMVESPGKTSAVKEKPIKVKAAKKKIAKGTLSKKIKEVRQKKTGEKKVTNIEAVVTLIRESAEGITTAVLKEKTGLAESQIWNIVNRATKEGRIRKIKRGVYGS
jgi:hypothetical protein